MQVLTLWSGNTFGQNFPERTEVVYTMARMNIAQKLRRAPYSAFVWAGGFAWMTVSFGTIVGVGLVRGGGPKLNMLAARLMSHCTRLGYPDFDVVYSPDFDPEQPSVFCQNHVNFMDAHTACRVIPGPFCGMMLAWHFHVPAYGWVMSRTNCIAVPKERGGRTQVLAAAVRERIDQGISVLVYPEAHRTRTGHVQDFKRGVFYMARDAGAPVVPLAVHGAHAVNRKGTWLFNPGPVRVWVGPQHPTQGLDDAALEELVGTLQGKISSFVDTGVVPE